jgi:ubiquinone/menaquinone biosynthesis C-methylase UbiE
LRTEKAAVQAFYDDSGWQWSEEKGGFADGVAFDDLRPLTGSYRRQANARVRAALLPTGGVMLDAASGAIQYDDYRQFSQGYRVRLCVDLSLVGLRAARRRIGAHGRFVRADVTALPFAAGTFDAVVSLHTLYHVPADEQGIFLAEVARVLAPGRRAVVVSVWETSPWDLALRLPGALARRARAGIRRLRRLDRSVSPSGPRSTPPTANLYFHPSRRGWLRRAMPPEVSLRVRCWRSVSVGFLRSLVPSGSSRRWLDGVGWLENACPGLLGWLGVYPLLMLEKPAGKTPPAS